MLLKVLLVIALKITEVVGVFLIFAIPYHIGILQNYIIERKALKKYPDTIKDAHFQRYRFCTHHGWYYNSDGANKYEKIINFFLSGIYCILKIFCITFVVIFVISVITYLLFEWILSNCQLADKILSIIKH